MGRSFLLRPDGQARGENAFFGADSSSDPSGTDTNHQVANDGTITDLEVSFARQHLEEAINQRDCGYEGPLGLGGLGGINEVCMQPWNMGGPAREATPDGYTMRVTMRVTEDYSVPTGILFFRTQRTATRDVEMTARWENGRVHLYQGALPSYPPPPPTPPAPDPTSEAIDHALQAASEGIHNFFAGAQSVASSAVDSIRNLFA